MDCIHPYCPKGNGLPNWEAVANDPSVKLQQREKAGFISHMKKHFNRPLSLAKRPRAKTTPPISRAALDRLLRYAPCLYNQLGAHKADNLYASARATVHFCELTLSSPITGKNVMDAFLVQHPKKGRPFSPGPIRRCKDGGTIMEMLCSEVLANAGIHPMENDENGWPIWGMPGHILLNEGKMARWKALGDILVPCAPTNLVISVKSEAARERLLYSANSIEGIGFGFFSEAKEFWTESRMTLLKRMGFSAIYMPDQTHAQVMAHLARENTEHHAINVNGKALYRPLSVFDSDMLRVVGKTSDLL